MAWRSAAALFLLAAGVLRADDISLVRVGDTWRYFRGTSEPSSPVTAWRGLGFNDSAWAWGPSGFDFSGNEATYVAPGMSSVYFRKTFTLASPSYVKWLVLRLDYAAGFVAYLNGTEVLRRGLAGEPVPYSAYASYHPGGAAVDFDVSDYTDLLLPGQNVLAIQMHVSAESPGSLALVPELLANFQRGPFVANRGPHSIEIAWRTPEWSDSRVDFGTDPTLGQSLHEEDLSKSHLLTLTNLAPDTWYYYRVRSSDGLGEAVSPVFSFRTARVSGNLSFAVLGDSGSGWVSQYRVAEVVAGTGADLVLHTGDLIYPYYTAGRADTRVMSIYGPHLRSTPYYFTVGNHELYSGTDQYYLDTVRLPVNPVTGTEHFYSFDHGDAHFVCLYVPTLMSNSITRPYLLHPGSVQHQWLTNDLAASAKPWKFLFLHSPLFDSSFHRFDDYDGNGLMDRLELQDLLLPLAKAYGVQAIFSGHAHTYERFAPAQGVHCFISGGGGYPLYYVSGRDDLSAQFWCAFHCLAVSVQGETMRVEARDQYGAVFDQAVIRKTPPPAQTWQALWQVPRVEHQPSDDGDGNILGQTFDLAGTPIPAVHGEFSNLGEVLVSNDSDYLYLGLRSVMIPDHANLFLFLESPRLAGVADLAGLGNGLPDPQGQGADGLDFLKNLAFTNFAPSLACILGDEMADGQFRSFQRPGLALDTGQGVFRLDASFSDVPAARVQQFNLSPQLFYPVLHQGYELEQNADFIEVAIPWVALGGAQPGDVIKIGAVVGGPDFDWDARARGLDTGFLGQALHGAGLGPVLLEGLNVQLAALPPFVDSDGDGLPDWWEESCGLDPYYAEGDYGADGDPDGDGLLNLQEYQAGTHPLDAMSGLRTAISLPAPGVVRVVWQTVPGRSYTVEYATDLSSAPVAFQALPGVPMPRTALDTSDTLDVDLSIFPSPPGLLFFRVRVN